MKIKITEPYLWLPVDVKEEKVLLHLYSEGEKIDEIAIRLGVTDCDYYAYKDVSAYKNKELEIIRYDEGNLDRIFQYPEKPQTVYPFRRSAQLAGNPAAVLPGHVGVPGTF